jgi:hypothetical protein
MEQRDVERIIKGVLLDMAAPFTLLDVERTEAGWHAMLKLKHGHGHVISVSLPDGPPIAIRTTLMHRIEAETESET